MYNARFSCLAQFIAYDKHLKKKYYFSRTLLPGSVNVPASLWDGRQSYRKGKNSIEIISRLETGRFYINISLKGEKELPDIEGNFEALHEDGMVEPIVVAIPFADNRGMYSHKVYADEGQMTVQGEN
jgi:hypothetical protein